LRNSTQSPQRATRRIRETILAQVVKSARNRTIGCNRAPHGDPLERDANLEDLVNDPLFEGDHPRAAIGRYLEDPLSVQDFDRFAHRNAADIKLAGNLCLDHTLPGLEISKRDGVDNRVRDPIGELAPAIARQPENIFYRDRRGCLQRLRSQLPS
jgi:hypothetical protein